MIFFSSENVIFECVDHVKNQPNTRKFNVNVKTHDIEFFLQKQNYEISGPMIYYNTIKKKRNNFLLFVCKCKMINVHLDTNQINGTDDK